MLISGREPFLAVTSCPGVGPVRFSLPPFGDVVLDIIDMYSVQVESLHYKNMKNLKYVCEVNLMSQWEILQLIQCDQLQ